MGRELHIFFFFIPQKASSGERDELEQPLNSPEEAAIDLRLSLGSPEAEGTNPVGLFTTNPIGLISVPPAAPESHREEKRERLLGCDSTRDEGAGAGGVTEATGAPKYSQKSWLGSVTVWNCGLWNGFGDEGP